MTPASFTSAFRAFHSRNYRLFFAGQGVSLIGTWMTRIATSWLVYRLSKSPMLLGIASFAGQIPLFFLAPLAGVWVDRWDRHKTLVVTQVLSMLQSFALAALALSGVITIWQIIVLGFLGGLVNAFDMPARQSFVIQMVDQREDLPNAIALNSSLVNGARLIGPAIAGVLIGVVGEGYCFLIDGISYLAVIASLLLMHITAISKRILAKNLWGELGEGWQYVSGSLTVRSILLLLGLISLLGIANTVLGPIFAAQVLHGGAHTLGYLMAASGVGALIGAVGLAFRRSVLGLGTIIPISAGLFGVASVGFGLSRALWLSALCMAVTGFGMMRHLAASNTILQTIVDEDKRGRVMSFMAMAFAGMSPFGSLLAGYAAGRIGAPATVIVCGSISLLGAVLFAIQLPGARAEVRPIYLRLGILPSPPVVESVPELP